MTGEGNQAYVDGERSDVTCIIQPNRTEGHLRPGCPRKLPRRNGLPDKALQLRIMAAHLKHDPEQWYKLAQQSRYDLFPSVLIDRC